jgi:hypothetical protein
MAACKKAFTAGSLNNIPPPVGPTVTVYDVKVTTNPVTNITGISAFTGGIVMDRSVPAMVTNGYIELNTKPDFAPSGNVTISPYNVQHNAFFCFISGLHPQTTYYIRARSENYVSDNYGNLYPQGITYGDTISFTTDSLLLGMKANGGIVFFIDSSGEHGLISALSDLPDAAWSGGHAVTGAISTTDGYNNTYANVAADSAAASCASFTSLGWDYSWYLPAKDQLEKMYLKKDLIGGFNNKIYWSSTETDSSRAFAQDFSNGNQSSLDKNLKYGVRPIRQF